MAKSKPPTDNQIVAVSTLALVIGMALIIGFCATENYSEGERFGFLTKFSRKGRFYKSWEGELNLTQTGMNTSSLFEFSIDNDKEDKAVIATIDSAVNNGWKVKLTYHETSFKNFFKNRGETDYFVNGIQVLDKNGLGNNNVSGDTRVGRIVDTIYMVIDKNELRNRK